MGKDLKGKELGPGILQRKDGLYQGSYGTGENRHFIYDKKLLELKRRLRTLIYESEHGLLPEGTKTTVEAWSTIWFKNYKNGVREVTKRSYRTYIRMINENLGQMILTNVKQLHVVEMVNYMHEKGYADGTIKGMKTCLYNMFQRALENGLVNNNPVRGISVSFDDNEEKEVKALSIKEQRIFQNSIEDSHYRELFNVMLLTGLRISEAMGLRWSDINLDKKELHVKRSIVSVPIEGSYQYMINPTKSRSSRRTIPLNDEAVRFLKDQWEKTKDIEQHDNLFDDMVFVGRSGKSCSFTNISKILKTRVQTLNKKGYEIQHISTHMLRHTFATRCYESGMSLKVVSKILGHSKLDITADRYTHVLPENAVSEMNKLMILGLEESEDDTN